MSSGIMSKKFNLERELESVLPRFQLGQRSRPLPPLLFLDTMFLFDLWKIW
uniref:Uncharacterized protein n=1 Tax=Poecilia latipinna TaxID=48699 RepID=A0A3B3TYT5_9TELE